MRRTWRIYRAFVRSSLVRAMMFKADFFAKLLQVASWLTFVAFFVFVLYRNTDSVAGWERGPAFVLAGTAFLVSAVCYFLFPSLIELPEQFRRGTLDFVLTKPVDSQFWVSARRIELSDIGSCAGSAGMVAFGLSNAAVRPTAAEWLAYATCVVAGVAILYSLRLALMTLGVWFVRVDNIWVLEESAMQVARNPVDIFSKPVRVFLTVVVPLALFATVPARQLVGPAHPGDVGLAAAWAVAALFLSRRFWVTAMRSYASASS
jgi:ABC-2 type transport system permease protein